VGAYQAGQISRRHIAWRTISEKINARTGIRSIH
jgi:hypothetical protein